MRKFTHLGLFSSRENSKSSRRPSFFRAVTLASLVLGLGWGVNAQTLNQTAPWPSTSWVVSGNFNTTGGVVATPDTNATFSYDDDAAGGSSVADSILATSPVIDLTAAQAAGETWINITADYVYELLDVEVLKFQYYDADAAVWTDLGSFTDNGNYTCGDPTSTFKSDTLDISGFTSTQLSGFQYRILYNGNNTWGYGFCMSAPTITSSIPVSCLPPSSLGVNFISATDVELTWTDNTPAPEYQIKYGASGFTQGTGTLSVTTNNPDTITGLTANSNYDYYVRSICTPGSDTSSWAGPYSFYTGYCTSVPTSHDNSGITAVVVGSENYTGTNSNYEDFTSGAIADLAQNVNANLQVTFGTGYTYDCNVWIDFNNNLTFEASELVYQGTSLNTNPTTLDASFLMPATAALGNHRMRIGSADNGQATPNPCYNGSFGVTADFTINVIAAPSCLPPSSLNANLLSQTSADLSWTELGSANAWQIEYGTSGFTQGSGTLVSAANDTTNVSTLTANTNYDFYVRAICGPGDTSAWSSSYSFYTGYCTPTTTYTGDYVSGITTTGALQNINYTASSQPVGSYEDKTSDTLISYPGQSFDVTETYVGGTSDIKIWVDLNNNLVFDASELVYSGNGVSPQSFTIPVPLGLTPGVYRMRVRGMYDYSGGTALPPCGNVNYGSTIDFSLKLMPTPSCLPPNNLSASNLNGSTADLSWTEIGGASSWQIEYDTTGFTLGSGNISIVSNDTTTVTVSPSATYDFYVRSICSPGDTSYWSGPYTFASPCLPEAIPYVQDFTSGTFPNCWTTNDPSNVYVQAGNCGSRTDILRFDYSKEATTGIFDVTAAPSVKVSYYIAESVCGNVADAGEKFQVQYWNGTQWTVAKEYDASRPDEYTFESFYVPQSDLSSTFRLKFAQINGTTDTWMIDSLVVEVGPTCSPIANVVVDSTSTSAIQVSWNAGGSETSWNVEWGAPGFTPGTGTEIGSTTVSDTTYLITGLPSSSQFDIYVQADCGSGDLSPWYSSVSAFTDCATITSLPWTENFDNMATVGSGVVPHCWTNLNGEFYTTADSLSTYYGSSANGYGHSRSGSNAMYIDYYADDYVWTPKFQLTAGTQYEFSFWQLGDSYTGWDGTVLYSPTQSDTDAVIIDTFIVNTTASELNYRKVFVCFTPSTTGEFSFGVHIVANFSPDVLSFDDFTLKEVQSAGTAGDLNVCQTGGLVNLNSVITIGDPTGTWTYGANPYALVQDSLFDPSSIAAGDRLVYYTINGCLNDSVAATLHIFPPSSAGTDGTITVCKNAPVDLFSGLSGNADLGGQWFNSLHQPISGSLSNAGNIPGTFNYFYKVSNAACPADSSIVAVVVDGTCDWLGITNENFNKLSVFPNPTSDQLNIVNPSNESNLHIIVLDMNGRVVLDDNKSLADAEQATLSLGKLEKGIYTLKIFNKEGQRIFKIVKQ